MNNLDVQKLTFNIALNFDGLNFEDIDKRIIQKKVEDAEKDLASGQFMQVLDDLRDLKFNTILAVERLRYLAKCRVTNEWELSRVPFWEEGFSNIIELCDTPTAESYQAIKTHTMDITAEFERLSKLVNAKMYNEALDYINSLKRIYPEYAIFKIWTIEVKLQTNDKLITILNDLKELSEYKDLNIFFYAHSKLTYFNTFNRESNWWIYKLSKSDRYLPLICPSKSTYEGVLINFGSMSYSCQGTDGVCAVLTVEDDRYSPYFSPEEQKIVWSVDTERGYFYNSKKYTVKVAITQHALDLLKQKNEEKIAREQKEKERLELEKRQREERRANNLCVFCGSEFKGIFKKVCKKCGKPKSY